GARGEDGDGRGEHARDRHRPEERAPEEQARVEREEGAEVPHADGLPPTTRLSSELLRGAIESTSTPASTRARATSAAPPFLTVSVATEPSRTASPKRARTCSASSMGRATISRTASP